MAARKPREQPAAPVPPVDEHPPVDEVAPVDEQPLVDELSDQLPKLAPVDDLDEQLPVDGQPEHPDRPAAPVTHFRMTRPKTPLVRAGGHVLTERGWVPEHHLAEEHTDDGGTDDHPGS